ncbi:MAG: copper oxidase, partial [Fusobacteria bacterium]
DMNRIDEYVKLNEVEIWEISNTTGEMMMGGMMGRRNNDVSNGNKSLSGHPFHIHAVQFRILSRDGRPPQPYENGWKDTIFVEPGEIIRIAVKFEDKGLFMYHCHILEHEDNGMMGTFLVE